MNHESEGKKLSDLPLICTCRHPSVSITLPNYCTVYYIIPKREFLCSLTKYIFIIFTQYCILNTSSSIHPSIFWSPFCGDLHRVTGNLEPFPGNSGHVAQRPRSTGRACTLPACRVEVGLEPLTMEV